jgi:2-polyprenyl-3-methyl-5-hydroxy-6-metoxy-1,4-benzoquinol methylase
MTSKDERKAREDFSLRYSLHAPIADVIEERVIGGAWGANGFTTKEQADVLAALLELGEGMRLLDIGSGRGWPGLYLAKKTGCEVVLSDQPTEGLATAMRRAQREDIKCLGGISASARDLPFKPESFDTIVHTDVLC